MKYAGQGTHSEAAIASSTRTVATLAAVVSASTAATAAGTSLARTATAAARTAPADVAYNRCAGAKDQRCVREPPLQTQRDRIAAPIVAVASKVVFAFGQGVQGSAGGGPEGEQR